MISFWERSSLLRYDIIIVGSGIVGLNTAINLRERFPDKTIAIFERGILPSGASTKNAGFACFGSLSELTDDLRHLTADAIYDLFRRRKNGIQLLRSRLGDRDIGYDQAGSHELLTEAETDVLEQLDFFNSLLRDLDSGLIFSMAGHIIPDYGFSASSFRYAISANTEGSIHTGKMMQRLLQLAMEKNIVIRTGVHVTRFEEHPGYSLIEVSDPVTQSAVRFQCSYLAFCTNAFSPSFFPDLDITPGRGQVLITQPIRGLKPKGIFHFDKGYYYFRVIENRILFGGGRNLDFEGENTGTLALNIAIQEQLIQHLKTAIIPGLDFEVDMQWSGIMAFGSNKIPILHRHSDRVFGAFRLGGMGVALGSQLAIDLSALMQAHME